MMLRRFQRSASVAKGTPERRIDHREDGAGQQARWKSSIVNSFWM